MNIVILTGAGISADSGVDTFRDEGGIWSKVDIEDVATPQGFERNPQMVLDFYNARRRNMVGVEPNPAHRALARLEADYARGGVLVVTQNIDDLHERAGSKKLVHMHGEMAKAKCAECGHSAPYVDDLTLNTVCGACGAVGRMRPDVVWFGEMPMELDRIYEAMAQADLFVSIGTSGHVYPAAGFVESAQMVGCPTLELNLERTSRAFDVSRQGRAKDVVPRWVEDVLSHA